MHALNLIENDEYKSIALVTPKDIFASPRFVERLIRKNILQELDDPTKGDLVVYFDSISVMHIGRLLSESRVESKWGIGHLYHHGLFEVPERYGSIVRYFIPISSDVALDEYVAYAREHGVKFHGDS